MNRRARPLRLLAPGLALLVAGCATRAPAPSLGTLSAVLWMQRAAEYRAAAEGTYAAAARSLRAALADSSWTAATEQSSDYGALPPAVIVDADETVLDNSPYQARLIQAEAAYSPESWTTWVAEASAGAVPGALAFAAEAAGAGVTIFYVTNRDVALEAATRANLERLGFPLEAGLEAGEDLVLTRGEHPGWTSDKTSRRAAVAARYRVVLLLGDDLNDFVTADGVGARARAELLERYRENWGVKWFVLPNPVYGSWERTVLGEGAGTDPTRRKIDALITGRRPR